MQQYDFVIVGNGIIAHSIAFELNSQYPGLKIAMIGPSQQDGAATLAAGAMLGCFAEVSKTTMRYRPQYEKFKLSLKARNAWQQWMDKINQRLVNPQRIRQGTFVILNAKSGNLDDDNFQATLSLLDKHNEPYQSVSPDSIPGLNPVMDSRPLQSIFVSGEGSIDAHLLMKNLHSVLLSQDNIDYIDTKIATVHQKGNTISHVEDVNGNAYYANKFIFSAGAFTQPLIDQIPTLKTRIPRLFYGVGISMLLKVPKVDIQHVIRTPNRSFACGLHVVPRNENTLFLGSTNNVASSAAFMPKPAQLHFLLQCLLQQINQDYHMSSIEKIQVGNRPVPFDTFPTFGQTSIDNLIMASGTYRDGILLSPLIADYITSLAVDKKETFHNPFPCERPPIMPMSQEDEIELAVKHYISGAFEHETQLPKVGWYEMFEGMIRDKITKLHRAVNSDDIYIPADLLLMFDDHYDESLAYFQQYLKDIRQEYPQFQFEKPQPIIETDELAVS